MMKASLLLADFAQVADGKLNLMGAGWNITGPNPSPFALGLIIDVPWDQANEQHRIRVELLDSDGQPVAVPSPPDGEPRPLVIEANVEVGRPPGLKRGTPLVVPLALNMPPQPLEPNGRYEWRMTINGEAHEDWRAAFSTRPTGFLPPTQG